MHGVLRESGCTLLQVEDGSRLVMPGARHTAACRALASLLSALGKVPLHPLHTDPAAGPAGLARLLAAALGAGMNALRIWCAARSPASATPLGDEAWQPARRVPLVAWKTR